MEQINRYFCEAGLRPQMQMEFTSISAVLDVIRRTSLSTLLPAAIAMQNNDLVAIPLADWQLERTGVLMQRKGAWQTTAARVFIEVAQELGHVLNS